MKRLKMFFLAVSVFAVVGGALAFKSPTFANFCHYTKVSNTCPFDVQLKSSVLQTTAGIELVIPRPVGGCPTTQPVTTCNKLYTSKVPD